MSSVIQLLNPAQTTVQYSITPCRRAFLVTRVVLVGPDVVFVGWCKGDSTFVEGAETEARVLAFRGEELVAVEEFCEVVLTHGFDDYVARDGVDAVIEVAIKDANLVVHDHGPISAADEVVCAGCETALACKTLCL